MRSNEMPEGVSLNFTFACGTCGEVVRVENGKREPHPCPSGPAVELEGCHQMRFLDQIGGGEAPMKTDSGRRLGDDGGDA